MININIDNEKFQEISKRIIDIIIPLGVLLLFCPILLFFSLLIKLSSKGSVFYKWKIIGKNGKRIISYKFRTMIEDAEKLETILREAGTNDMSDIYFKLEDDPRITRIGRFLRKFSIDELPSLYSVLKGDMTLVGPRPVRWHEYDELEEWHKVRFQVKPGITSPWVVKGKNEIKDFDEIVKLDLEYIENCSFLYDLKIILKTIPIVVFGKNY